MATRKKTARKASTKKASTKKASTKKVTAKRTSTVDESRKIKAYAGQEEHFYTNKKTGKLYPRGQAYEILSSAKNRTMSVGTFLDRLEKLPEVKSRAQARGIVQKLIGKPNEAADKGRVCSYV